MLILILCSAAPGKDISIFRPTSGGEVAVDVSIITQLLVPILERRECDGTAIFDAFGTGLERKFNAPDEIIILCVDCSASMGEDTDFAEIREDDYDSDESTVSETWSDLNSAAGDDGSFFHATLDEMKSRHFVF